MKLRTLLPLLLILVTFSSFGRSYYKYKFHFSGEALPGIVTITWGLNTPDSVTKLITNRKFVITIKSMFEDIYLQDTVDRSSYSLDTNNFKEKYLIFYIDELMGQHETMTLIKVYDQKLPTCETKLDSLNAFLLGGNFINAVTLLNTMNRQDLIGILAERFSKLSDNYLMPGFLDCYFNEKMELVIIPKVEGIDTFIKTLNESPLNRSLKKEQFIVYVKISSSGQTENYEVMPEEFGALFEQNHKQLSFTNSQNKPYTVVLRVGLTTAKQKKYYLINKDALDGFTN